jgi:hypothetical protein
MLGSAHGIRRDPQLSQVVVSVDGNVCPLRVEWLCMNQPLPSDLFPSGFPSELASAAFVASDEAAWRPALAAGAVEWLSTHGYAVLGTEVWLPKDGSIQSLPYFQNVDRQGDEAWDLFVARAAAETLAYLRASTPKFIEEGDVYVNVTWVGEAEYR